MKTPLLVKLGKTIRKIREEKGWSQEELAFKTDLHRTYIGGVERGERNISLLNLKHVSKTLGVSVEEVMKISKI